MALWRSEKLYLVMQVVINVVYTPKHRMMKASGLSGLSKTRRLFVLLAECILGRPLDHMSSMEPWTS
jgi:hypothetical protein